jgi:hypothetical protein
MLKVGSIILALISASLMILNASAGTLETDIVGKWSARTPRGEEIMQFFSGGIAITINPDAPQDTWAYQVLDGGHIRLDNQTSLIRHPIVVEASIDGDVLTLTQNGKIIGRYRRMHSSLLDRPAPEPCCDKAT